jgi:uroporphyrinogen decarboxylase
MTPKERILAVLNRQPVDRLPVDLWYTPEIAVALRQHFGVQDDSAMWQALGLDKIVWDFIDYKTEGGERAGAQSGAGAESGGDRTMWGVPLRQIQAGEAHYAEFGAAPLKGYDTPGSLAAYPWWPQLDRFDYDGAVALAERASRDYPVIGPWVSLLEIYCQLRGLERSMLDLCEKPKLVDAILDRVEDIQMAMMKRLFARGGKHLELVFISDDIAGQQALLMSPRMWAAHLQPRLKRWCDLIHAHGLRVFYHTDGAARPLLKPILDCGVDVLNPIQHACPGMDLAELKKEFGSRVIFHGGVDNQSILPRGTAEQVRAEVKECLRTLGAGGEGFICCSCHNVQAGTPLENILAMVETVHQSADRPGERMPAGPRTGLARVSSPSPPLEERAGERRHFSPNPMNKVRIGVIGAGWWATSAHIPAVNAHPEAVLVAVQSREKTKAERIARDFGAKHACTSLDEMLSLEALDAVIISSTPNVHFVQAKAALQRGLHVLIEKPMTFTAAEARELVALAAQRKLHLLVSCPWHFTAHALEARRLLQSGQLGELKLISVLMTNPVDKLLRGINTVPTHNAEAVYVEPRPGSYSDPEVAGGGQIFCQVSHAAAFLTFLTGFRAAEVYSRFDRDGSPNDLYNALTITLENGTLVNLASTAATPLDQRNYEIRVFGTKAILQLELWQGTMTLTDFAGNRTEFIPLNKDEIYPSGAPALNLIDVILGKARNGSPGELGLASMEIIEAACESAQTNRCEQVRPVKHPHHAGPDPSQPAAARHQA